MTDSRAALDPDRLPWLNADSRPARPAKPAVTTAWSLLVSWGVVILLLVAGGAYWLGRTTELDRASEPVITAPRATVTLPQPVAESKPAPPAPKVELAPPPPVAEVAPQRVAAEPVVAAKPKAAKSKRVAKRPAPKARKAIAAKPKAKRTATARPVRAKRPRRVVRSHAWPSPPTALYLGRMIQLGTYSTRARLDRAWSYRLQRYPQLRGLPKVVVPYRDSYGSTRYRLQAMTVAPQQASWLCRKIRAEWKSCSVLRAKTANG